MDENLLKEAELLGIQREEIRIQSENRLEVVDHTKTYTDRVGSSCSKSNFDFAENPGSFSSH